MEGDGIESLIPDKKKKTSKEEKKEEAVFLIEVEKIKPNPYQPRKNFDQEGLKTLAASIRTHGVLQPLIVNRLESDKGKIEYQLIAGERRLMAAKMVGLTQVPVIIRRPDEKQKLELSLIENVQRENLNPMERAQAFRQLKDKFGFTHKEIGNLVGKSRVAVSNAVRLLDLPDKIKEGVKQGKITEGHGRAILMVQDGRRQLGIYSKILKNNLSVKETEELAQQVKVEAGQEENKKKNKKSSSRMKNWERKAKKVFGEENTSLDVEEGDINLNVSLNSEEELKKFLSKFK